MHLIGFFSPGDEYTAAPRMMGCTVGKPARESVTPLMRECTPLIERAGCWLTHYPAHAGMPRNG